MLPAMKSALKKLFLLALETDSQAESGDAIWLTKCLHCRAKLFFKQDGEPLGNGSLEHVVPKSWFEQSGARELCTGLTSPDDPRNLALACRRCNNQKGYGPDLAGPHDDRAYEVVQMLQRKRLDRWREPPPDSLDPDAECDT
jgi:5-methylcytosine-specific restriction endonuclease McrA